MKTPSLTEARRALLELQEGGYSTETAWFENTLSTIGAYLDAQVSLNVENITRVVQGSIEYDIESRGIKCSVEFPPTVQGMIEAGILASFVPQPLKITPSTKVPQFPGNMFGGGGAQPNSGGGAGGLMPTSEEITKKWDGIAADLKK